MTRRDLTNLAVFAAVCVAVVGCAAKPAVPKADGVTEAGRYADQNHKRHETAAGILEDLEKYSR